MPRLFRLPLGNRQAGGGPERSADPEPQVTNVSIDPVESVQQYLGHDAKTWPDKAALLGELNVLRVTKGLSDGEREKIADNILEAREKRAKRS